MNTHAYVVIGPSASGKSVLATALQDAGFAVFELSRGIPALLPRSPLTFRERLAYLSKIYRETAGRALIDMLLPDLKSAFRQRSVAIIGARQVPEIEVIHRELGEPRMIAIHAPATIRFARAAQRRRPDAAATFEEFLRLTFWEYSLGLAELMFQAERILDNSTSDGQFRATCAALAVGQIPPPG